MSNRLVFETVHGPWSALGVEYVDRVELEDADPELVKLAGSAHAAGVITVLEGLDVSHVESQEDSEAALAAAMGDWIEPVRDPETGVLLERGRWSGPWQEGHDANAELADHGVAELAIDVEADR
jgi:hypothetical protein